MTYIGQYDGEVRGSMLVAGDNIRFESADRPDAVGLVPIIDSGGTLALRYIPDQDTWYTNSSTVDVPLTSTAQEIVNVSPAEDIAAADGSFRFSCGVSNAKNRALDVTISVKVNGTEVYSQDVTIPSSASNYNVVISGKLQNDRVAGDIFSVDMSGDTDLTVVGTQTASTIAVIKAAATVIRRDLEALSVTDPVIEQARIGDATGEVKLDKDGVHLVNNATVWKDMVGDLFSKKLYSAVGKVDYDWDQQAIVFQPGGDPSVRDDRVHYNIQVDHQYKVSPDSSTAITFKPHIHWFQFDTALQATFQLDYRVLRNGASLDSTAAWTSVTVTTNSGSDAFPFALDVGHDLFVQITHFPDINEVVGLSDTIQCRITRTDANVGNVLVFFADMHGEIDSLGSNEEMIK